MYKSYKFLVLHCLPIVLSSCLGTKTGNPGKVDAELTIAGNSETSQRTLVQQSSGGTDLNGHPIQVNSAWFSYVELNIHGAEDGVVHEAEGLSVANPQIVNMLNPSTQNASQIRIPNIAISELSLLLGGANNAQLPNNAPSELEQSSFVI